MSEARREPAGPWRDPIVAEVRAARLALLAEADYDLHALCERLRQQQVDHGREVIRRPPRAVAADMGRSA